MHEITAAYERLIARYVQWARNEDNIRATVVIGSRARVDHPADAWSDLDVIILVNDPELFWATGVRFLVDKDGFAERLKHVPIVRTLPGRMGRRARRGSLAGSLCTL
jgi:predicted nucleotidyltransferase